MTEDVPSNDDLKEAAEALASQLAQKRRERIKEALADWVWVSEAYAFVRRSDRKVWTDKQWTAHFGHLVAEKENVLNYAIKKTGYISKFEKLVFEPNAPEEIDGLAYNLWRPSGISAAPGDSAWFVDHINYLFPDVRVADDVLDFLALLVKEPFVKVLFAMLVYGPKHGTGKSAIGAILSSMLGASNLVFPSNDEISEKYSQWQEGAQLGVIEELMMLGRQQIANRLKPVITQPDLRIRAMWRPSYTTPNRLNLIAFTNYPDALKVENDDRRWFIAESPVEPLAKDYYEKLFAHIECDADVAAVKHFLQHREVRLDPKGRAPATQAKREMVEQSLSDEEAYILELLDEGGAPFDFDLIRREDIIDALRLRFGTLRPGVYSRMTSLLKTRIGAVSQKQDKRVGVTHHRLWSLRDHEQWDAAGPAARTEAYEEYVKARELAKYADWPHRP
jgi:hypothetical protein